MGRASVPAGPSPGGQRRPPHRESAATLEEKPLEPPIGRLEDPLRPASCGGRRGPGARTRRARAGRGWRARGRPSVSGSAVGEQGIGAGVAEVEEDLERSGPAMRSPGLNGSPVMAPLKTSGVSL